MTKKDKLKTYKERAEYLSYIFPEDARFFRAISIFFGENEVPPKMNV